MRVGIFGGAFNPPHLGHMVCAGEALWQLDLERILFVPVGVAPHRDIGSDPGARTRLELCELACLDEQRFEVSAYEVEKATPAFTFETLEALRAEHQGWEMLFVVGGDQALDFPNWREPSRVLESATLAIAEREGARRDEIERALSGLRASDRLRFFDMPRIEVSSTMVRERVAVGRPYRHLVPERVGERIAGAGLYQAGAEAIV